MFLILPLTLFTTAAVATLSVSTQSTLSGWQHDWETPASASAWWGYAALPGRALTDAEVNCV